MHVNMEQPTVTFMFVLFCILWYCMSPVLTLSGQIFYIIYYFIYYVSVRIVVRVGHFCRAVISFVSLVWQ